MTEKMGDTWSTLEYPVLLAAARILQGGARSVDVGKVCELTGLSQEDVDRAGRALIDEADPPYLVGQSQDTPGGSGGWLASALTERGRREVGLWPSGENVDALVQALEAVAASEANIDERSKLQRAAAAVGNVSRDVMVQVAAAYAARISGAA